MQLFDLKEPKKIYSIISREVNAILEKLNVSMDDKNLEDARDEAMKSLEQAQRKLKREEDALECNAEWDTYTIAFYGETNAGKSTIIEMLRIALGEQTKAGEREQFQALQNKLGLSEEKLNALKASVDQAASLISGFQEQMGALRDRIAEIRKAASFWQKAKHLFIKLPEQGELRLLEVEQSRVSRQKEKDEQEYSRLQDGLTRLEPLSDGNIVGDGRPDFTRVTHTYAFDQNGCKFALLDVPGIEGREAEVGDEISKAAKKAHAVFYVTGKAAPPQTGEDKDPHRHNVGTLEKIKRDLGAQTEVWTLFNKRIVNPMPLGKAELLNEGEIDGLTALNKAMREHLGVRYRDAFALSAYPAFLAVSDHLLPGSDNFRNRRKFLEKFVREKLLEKSQASRFIAWVRQLADDAPLKIRRSNFNKANEVLKSVSNEVAALKESWKELSRKVGQDTKGAQSQLDSASKTLRSSLIALSSTLLDEFESSVRREIYSRIENDLGKDEFKAAMENIVNRKVAEMEEAFPKLIDQRVEAFQADILEVIEKFKEHIEELQEVFQEISSEKFDSDFEIQLNLESGIQWVALIASLGGVGAGVAAVLAASGGWIALAVAGVLASLVGVWKSLRGFLSAKYKMDQQRKEANKNLSNIISQLRNALNSKVEKEIFPKLEEMVEEIDETMEIPMRQTNAIHEVLTDSVRELRGLSRKIDTVIAV